MAPEAEAEAEGETANRIPSQGPSHTDTQDRGHAASWIRPENGYRSDRMWGDELDPRRGLRGVNYLCRAS